MKSSVTGQKAVHNLVFLNLFLLLFSKMPKHTIAKHRLGVKTVREKMVKSCSVIIARTNARRLAEEGYHGNIKKRSPLDPVTHHETKTEVRLCFVINNS